MHPSCRLPKKFHNHALGAAVERFQQAYGLSHSRHIVYTHQHCAMQYGVHHGSQGAFQTIPDLAPQHVPQKGLARRANQQRLAQSAQMPQTM